MLIADYNQSIQSELLALRGLVKGKAGLSMAVSVLQSATLRLVHPGAPAEEALDELGQRTWTIIEQLRELRHNPQIDSGTLEPLRQRAYRLATLLIMRVHLDYGDSLWSAKIAYRQNSGSFVCICHDVRRRFKKVGEAPGAPPLFNQLSVLYKHVRTELIERQGQVLKARIRAYRDEEEFFCARLSRQLTQDTLQLIATLGSHIGNLAVKIDRVGDIWELGKRLSDLGDLYDEAWGVMEDLEFSDRRLYHYSSPAAKAAKSLLDRRRHTLFKQLSRIDHCCRSFCEHRFFPRRASLPRPLPAAAAPERVSKHALSCEQQMQLLAAKPAPSELALLRPGDCRIIRHDDEYTLEYLDRAKQKQSVTLLLMSGGIVCGWGYYPSIYELLSSRVPNYCLLHSPNDTSLRALAYRQLYPHLLGSKDEWAAMLIPLSKRETVWLNRHGDIYHAGQEVLGSGGFKEVSRMQQIFSSCIKQPLAAGLFLREDKQADPELLTELRADFGEDPRFLIPQQIALRVLNRPEVESSLHAQQMPEMAGDLFAVWGDLSALGRLRALRQCAEIFCDLHDRRWYFADGKPHNILVRKPLDRNYPHVCLADFDLAERVRGRMRIYPGTSGYNDPLVEQGKSYGWKAGRIADQFSFAMTALYLLTDNFPEQSRTELILGAEIQPWQLNAVPGWLDIDSGIRVMLKSCLVGLKERRYLMRDFVKVLESAILMRSCDELHDRATSPEIYY